MKPENPFADLLKADLYGGAWVPVGMLGRLVDPGQNAILFPAGSRDEILQSSDWPLRLDAAGPEVYVNADDALHGVLHPQHMRGGLTVEPFLALFSPPTRSGWLEPIQAFVLDAGAAPRHKPEGSIEWEIPDDDGKPQAMARWTVSDGTGTLSIRRTELMQFLAAFDFDLALYLEARALAPELESGWCDEDRSEHRAWRCWAGDSGLRTGVRALLRMVTVVPCPQHPPVPPWLRERAALPFIVGLDPEGRPVEMRHPPDDFLTPVFFRETVLERYLADPDHYSVDESMLRAGAQWHLDIAQTGDGHIHAYLGDLNELPESVQRHWQTHAVPYDGGIPEWRIRRDLLNQFVDPPKLDPVSALREALAVANTAAERHVGVPLFKPVDPINEGRVRTLHIPTDNSMASFQRELAALAVLTVESLNKPFLEAVDTPPGEGPLNRLAKWVARVSGADEQVGRDVVGGLFAVQALRSKVAAHRGGEDAEQALTRADISKGDLPDGFRRLIERATASVRDIADLLLRAL